MIRRHRGLPLGTDAPRGSLHNAPLDLLGWRLSYQEDFGLPMLEETGSPMGAEIRKMAPSSQLWAYFNRFFLVVLINTKGMENHYIQNPSIDTYSWRSSEHSKLKVFALKTSIILTYHHV